MKVIAEKDRIILVGKAWEIKAKLKEYNHTYSTVKEWIDANR
ncbi:Z-ring formation inhibitor MciZ [Rossellomorea vietnamensis]|uniref:PadR family transcriptional regulator n=1 Tax=Rossellomorea vietnamensis TaxID=218284 RepID=A0A0N8GGX4_9BACI|nr:Z-ring formation inhibitor MciZ [Rossellomorea vietnamensis]KPL59706.1 PadR family transcriptional regulator [Rossellomorea vietnamensis]